MIAKKQINHNESNVENDVIMVSDESDGEINDTALQPIIRNQASNRKNKDSDDVIKNSKVQKSDKETEKKSKDTETKSKDTATKSKDTEKKSKDTEKEVQRNVI